MKKLLTILSFVVSFISNAQSVSITSSASGAVCSGTNVTFTAITSGVTNPTYQWYKNSAAISGATNSSYSTNALSNGDQIYVSVAATVSGSLRTTDLKFNYDAGNSSSYSGSGNTWTDLSGNNTNATFQNTPTFISSPIKTFQWNTRGSNGTNSTKASFSNVLGDDMTVGAWIKTSNSGNDYAHYRLLYILTGEQGGGANDWGFGINNTGKLAFGAGPNDVTISSSTAVNTNDWTYVVATRAKSTGQIKLYINGAFNNSGTGNAGNTLNAQSNILIADGNDGPAYTFEGNIAIIEGYNTVLSADDILANFNANKGRFGISSNLNSNTVTTVITNLSAPVTITGDACINKTTLSTTSGLTAYAWYKDDVVISGAITNTYIPTSSGSYKVQVSSGSCSSLSSATNITNCSVASDGSMKAISNSNSIISPEGGANFGTGRDYAGKLYNTTGISTTSGTIGSSTAVLGGIISPTNNVTTSIGVIYSSDINFGIYSSTTIQSNVAAGTYSSTITGLTSSTNYFTKSFIVNKAGISYGTVVSFTTTSPPIAVGSSYGGGVVYYILQSGDVGYDANIQHGLIAATTDQSSAVVWAKTNTNIGATAENIGAGLSNTNLIIANQGNTGSYGAKIARDYTGGGYTDWFLPSAQELHKLYLATSLLGANALGSNAYYLSSTEYSTTNFIYEGTQPDYYKTQGDGAYPAGTTKTNNPLRVRAIRYF